ncbi:molybdopterin-dependent oxidoreductase [Sorangium sp. So ce315]|uniref:molybdopterin-dependent oxidoreductase n=1 Tax=Sorangium sp. So ce315 TaxID=3133299 RepID=UPI003F5F4481
MDRDRRELLKCAAMGAATVAASRLALGEGGVAAAEAAPAAPAGADVVWNKAPCRFCGTGCHVQVGVKGGRVVAVAGDQRADVNKGLLCVKGYHVGLALYGKDRLTRPLLRKNGKLEPIGWDEAIEIIARRAMQNPAGFALYGSGQWTIPEGYAANKLVKAGLGNNQIDPNARLCMASAVTGFLSTYGVDEPAGCYEDLDRCDVLILWGNNPAEMHPVLFSRVVDRRSRGEQVLLIDLTTRRTRTSAFCQHTLHFKPNTDLAIANGIAHLLVERGTYDRSFVERFCNFRQRTEPATLDGRPMSFEEYRRALAEYTPERVEAISGVAAKDIRMLADLFGRRDLRITSLWCMGMNQHTRGTAINDLVHGVHLLSGHFGKPGDAPTSLTGQPSACGTVREVGTVANGLPGGLVVTDGEHRRKAEHLWNLPEGRISPKPGYHAVELWKRFSTPKEQGGDIDTIWVMVTNPGQSLPNTNELFDASRRIPGKFLIVSDVYPTATVRAADLVLPSAMWVEKNGMFGNSERRTQQWFKMVEPPGEARDDAWQIIAVARKLHDLGFAGMKDKDGRFLFDVRKDGKEVPVWDHRRYYDVNVDEHLFEEYRKFTRYKHKDLAPYREYAKARGLRWPVVEQPDGTWRETRFRFARFDDPYATKGEIQFYHSVTRDDRALIWFHPYEPPPESPDADYPFWLCTGRVLEHWHTGSLTMRIPQLQRAMPQAYLEMNREDARKLGVGDGEVVIVESRRGALELPVWIEGRGAPAPGSVFVPFFDETVMVNRATLEAHDPLSKQPDYKKCAVRIRRKPQAARPGAAR